MRVKVFVLRGRQNMTPWAVAKLFAIVVDAYETLIHSK